MQTRATVTQQENLGIVYHVGCENPGCGHTFKLPVTPKQAGILAGGVTCPRCNRRGGTLKPAGRLGARRFSAKLAFKSIEAGSTLPGEEGDLLTDIS